MLSRKVERDNMERLRTLLIEERLTPSNNPSRANLVVLSLKLNINHLRTHDGSVEKLKVIVGN